MRLQGCRVAIVLAGILISTSGCSTSCKIHRGTQPGFFASVFFNSSRLVAPRNHCTSCSNVCGMDYSSIACLSQDGGNYVADQTIVLTPTGPNDPRVGQVEVGAFEDSIYLEPTDSDDPVQQPPFVENNDFTEEMFEDQLVLDQGELEAEKEIAPLVRLSQSSEVPQLPMVELEAAEFQQPEPEVTLSISTSEPVELELDNSFPTDSIETEVQSFENQFLDENQIQIPVNRTLPAEVEKDGKIVLRARAFHGSSIRKVNQGKTNSQLYYGKSTDLNPHQPKPLRGASEFDLNPGFFEGKKEAKLPNLEPGNNDFGSNLRDRQDSQSLIPQVASDGIDENRHRILRLKASTGFDFQKDTKPQRSVARFNLDPIEIIRNDQLHYANETRPRVARQISSGQAKMK
ncbi:MAG: hypothetical protein AAF939_09120 [Planctomycetota bacterium]